MASVNWRYLYPDVPANDDMPETRLHWIDWGIPPQVEIIKPRVR